MDLLEKAELGISGMDLYELADMELTEQIEDAKDEDGNLDYFTWSRL